MSRHCFGEVKQELEWETLRKLSKVCIIHFCKWFLRSTYLVKDLVKVLQIEPSNQSAQEELKKVTSLIEKEILKVPLNAFSSYLKHPLKGFTHFLQKSNKVLISPMQSSLDSSLANKRRRVPIKIIEPPSTAAAPSTTLSVGSLKPRDSRVLTSSQAVLSAANVKTDTLEPVSSRSLTVDASSRNSIGSFTAESGLIDNDTNLPSKDKTLPTLTPPADPMNGVFKPNSFKDVKQARENVKPSRVGGGIFRASGSNTILGTRNNGDSNVADLLKSTSSSTSSSSMGLSVKDDSKTSYTPVLKAPNTLFDFIKSWAWLRSTEEKWHLITVSIFRVIVRRILTLLTASYRAFLLPISQRCVKPLSNLLCLYPSCSVSWLYWMLRKAIPGLKPSFESIWRILRGYLGLIP